MSEKINIAELNIDVDALVKSAAEVKTVLEQVREEQKELIAAGQTTSVQFVRNAADLKTLRSAYNSQISAISKHTAAVIDQTNREKLLATVIGLEVESIEEAREQNKLLNQLRNQTNVTTEEGREQLRLLNEQLDRNNAFINENADAYLRQKNNIGNYRNEIKGAFDDLNIFNGGLSGFIDRANEAGGVGPLVKNSLISMGTGFTALTKSAMAFIATPIGATIAAIVIGVTALVAIFKKGVAEMNKTNDGATEMNKALARLNALISPLVSTFGKFAKETLERVIKGFNDLYDATMKAIRGFAELARMIGADNIASNIEGWVDGVEKVSAENQKILDLQNQYNKKSREARLIQLQYQRDAERLRQIRDDESLSTERRIQANRELGALLKKQAEEELAIQRLNLEAIDLEIKMKGNLAELEDRRIAALTEIMDIQERIAGQESEQMANINSLRREAANLAKQRADEAKQRAEEAKQRAKDQAAEAINQMNERLRIYLAEKAALDQNVADNLATQEEAHKRRLEIINAEYEASEKRQSDELKRQADILEAENEIAQLRLSVAQEIAQKELDQALKFNQQKLTENKFITDELYNQELARLTLIEEVNASFLEKSLENKVITQQEFEDKMTELQLSSEQQRQELLAQFMDQNRNAYANDLAMRIELAQNNFILEHQLRQEQLELQRQMELEEAEKTGADKALINEKYNKLQEEQDELLNANKVALASQTFGNLATIFGEHSRAGKAMAVMQATIDTYQAATAAYKAMAGIPVVGPALGAIAAGAAIAAGIANVKKITSTKEPKFARGGIFEVGGRLHSSGGTKFYGSDGSRFEAEKGEGIGILSRGAFSAFQTFNDTFRDGLQGGNGYMPSDSKFDIYEAIKNLPAPVVAVEDIISKSNSYVKSINYADL